MLKFINDRFYGIIATLCLIAGLFDIDSVIVWALIGFIFLGIHEILTETKKRNKDEQN
jgi:uncharacterized membrane protein